jgi:hypothetical protein
VTSREAEADATTRQLATAVATISDATTTRWTEWGR